MTVYNVNVFDKAGAQLFHFEWSRFKASGMVQDEEAKLMYGMLYSLKSFVSKISPTDLQDGFLFYKTSKYALHLLESPSGIKFVISTDPAALCVKELLQQFYTNIWLEYVVRDPLWIPGSVVTSELFKEKVDGFIKQSPLSAMKTI